MCEWVCVGTSFCELSSEMVSLEYQNNLDRGMQPRLVLAYAPFPFLFHSLLSFIPIKLINPTVIFRSGSSYECTATVVHHSLMN